MRDADETKSKEALPESERRRMALYDHIPGMVYRGRVDWPVETIYNSEQICGYSAGEFERGEVNWLDIMHPDDRDGVYEEGSKLAERQERIVQEYRIIAKGGDVRWVEDHKISYFGDDGVFAGIDGVVFDITKRKRAEEKYKFLFDAVPTGIGVSDFEGNILDCNRTTEEMLGYRLDELKSMNVKDYYTNPDERAESMEILKKKGKLRDLEVSFRRKDGSIIHVLINVDVIEQDGRKVLLATTRNITERMKAVDALKESEEKFRIITEQSFDVVFAADLDGTLTYASPSVERVFGYRPDEVIGRNMAELVPESEAPKVVQQFKDITAGKDVEGEEVQMRRKDGSIGIIEMNSGPVRKDGKIIGAQVSARDITRRRKAEDEIRKFKTISDRAGYGMAMADPEGRVIYINESFAKMHGYSLEMLIGKNLSVFHNEEQITNVFCEQGRTLGRRSGTREEITPHFPH